LHRVVLFGVFGVALLQKQAVYKNSFFRICLQSLLLINIKHVYLEFEITIFAILRTNMVN